MPPEAFVLVHNRSLPHGAGCTAGPPIAYGPLEPHTHLPRGVRAAWAQFKVTLAALASSDANEQVTFPPFPVTIAQLPVSRCQICRSRPGRWCMKWPPRDLFRFKQEWRLLSIQPH
jgi:hypothetical protein